MRLQIFSSIFLAASFFSTSVVQALPRTPVRGISTSSFEATGPAASQNLTDLVTWDNYTLSVLGQRVFILSGEFHPWRLPVVELWKDVIVKAKAAGFNTISIYLHWGLSNPSNGTIEFDHFRAVQPVLDFCKEVGMWMVMRPGPYINAETTAGGFPGWVVAMEGTLRTNDTQYFDAWQQYMDYVGEITAKNQISNGGPIIAVQIENEYGQRLNGELFPSENWDWPKAIYVEQLQQSLKNHGSQLPTMHNDASPRGDFINGPGEVNIYAFDTYPQSFDCSNPYVWKDLPTYYHPTHVAQNPEEPFWIPEAQGGAFNAWGQKQNYDACSILTGPDFERVFYKAFWAANVKMLNYYMLLGGTSWGGLAFPGVYTSYDYGCAIAENRLLTPKFDELKLQGLFLRSAREFYKTDWIADSSSSFFPDEVFVTYLRNPDTATSFYFVRHTNSSSLDTQQLKLNIDTAVGYLEVPQYSGDFTLVGRDHRIVVSNYHFGETTLLYSTANIFLSTVIDGMDVLFLYADPGADQGLEFSIYGNWTSPIVTGDLDVEWTNSTLNHTTFNFTTTSVGLSAIQVHPSLLVLASDTFTAISYWAPTIQSTSGDWDHYASFGTNETVLVSGPYLVRNASISGSELSIVGDLNSTVPLLVYAPKAVETIKFNGQGVEVSRNSWGALEGTLKTSVASISLPTLENWKYADSLPEIRYGYDDSLWTKADHTSTTNPFPPFANNSGSQILYANDYDYHTGNILWRGTFEAVGFEEGISLGISGGWAFAAQAWLNEEPIGFMWSRNGSDAPTLNETFTFPPGALKAGTNWITVLQDHMGYFEAGNLGVPGYGAGELSIKAPRGIQGYILEPQGVNNFTSWKVQGNFGGSSSFPDKTRGVYNEGGLFAERAGWHLPGFDDSDWESKSPIEGISEPGVGFYRTTFDLDVPDGYDVPINVVFGNNTGAVRAQLYVNGWQYGKFVANVGPQRVFPIPRGIISYNSTNTLAVSLWGMGPSAEDLKIDDIKLTHDEITISSIGYVAETNPGWEKRESF